MKKLITICALVCVWALPVAAESKPSKIGNADDLLLQAQKAAAKLRAVSYTASHLGDGILSKRLPITDGTVRAAMDGSRQFTRVNMVGTRMYPQAKSPTEFEYVNTGRWITHIDHGRRTFDRGATKTVQHQEEDALFPPFFLTNEAYATEMKAAERNLVGEETVDGVDCHVVEVAYDAKGMRLTRFFIGKEDLLLRRMIQTSRTTPMNAEIFLVRDLKVNPQLDASLFEPLSTPTAYRSLVRPSLTPTNTANRGGNGLLAKGTEAPEWTLPDADGKDVSLKSLRGQVVVIDFWASWCGPCKMAMPYLQQLSDEFKDKAVKVYSVNCRERGGDARARQYLKTKGFTYPQLFEGDQAANAYLVRGIPTIYVIGTDGKILMAERGFRPQKMTEIGKVINEELNKKQARVKSAEKTQKG